MIKLRRIMAQATTDIAGDPEVEFCLADTKYWDKVEDANYLDDSLYLEREVREWAQAMETEVQKTIFELKGFYHYQYHKDWETANVRLRELEKRLNQIATENEARA